MINLKVKTQWEGKVAIRDKFIQQAKEKNEDILIEHAGNIMLIPVDKIDEVALPYREKVRDKFSLEYHELVYFYWKPRTQKLF